MPKFDESTSEVIDLNPYKNFTEPIRKELPFSKEEEVCNPNIMNIL